MDPRVGVIVPAAGFGRRFGADGSKAYVKLEGRPILAHTLNVLNACPVLDWIQVLVQKGNEDLAAKLLKRYRIGKAAPPAAGGASRSASVVQGLKRLPASVRWVVIHDGARPCISQDLIERTLRSARRHGAAVCGLPVTSTVKQVGSGGRVCATLNRKQLWSVQTPQIFRRDWLEEAVRRAGRRLAGYWDDAHLLEEAGFPVRMVTGEPGNIKVTLPEDLEIARSVLRSRSTNLKK